MELWYRISPRIIATLPSATSHHITNAKNGPWMSPWQIGPFVHDWVRWKKELKKSKIITVFYLFSKKFTDFWSKKFVISSDAARFFSTIIAFVEWIFQVFIIGNNISTKASGIWPSVFHSLSGFLLVFPFGFLFFSLFILILRLAFQFLANLLMI